MNISIYGTTYRDNEKGKCKKAGVAFRVLAKHEGQLLQKDYETISTTRTYGDLWLSELLSLLNLYSVVDGIEHITLITNQIEAGKMAGKIERILVEALEKQKVSKEDVEHLVFKDGRHTPRPNNHLYAQVVLKLLEMHRDGIRFKQDHLPSKHTMDLVKGLHLKIAPHKVLIDKNKPKKTPPVIIKKE
ncbi:hypothetical protein [Azonexus hydrophilus]|uniref:hypothetical protein n=1 Tax=Azonexus hydrophilus TaxID=418702 RepID=UPI00049011AC|nr:hypothetical protein [Azonexus hydrophilus]